MIRWTLMQMMGRYQMETGRRLTIGELAAATGVARASITLALGGETTRVDLETLDKLISFFRRELNQAFTVADLLEYTQETT